MNNRSPVRIPRALPIIAMTIAASSGSTSADIGAATPAARVNPITATDLLGLRSITEIEIASDASRAIFTIQSIEESPDSEDKPWDYRTHLFSLDLTAEGALPVQLTFGERNDAAPRIAPDGSALAFVRTPPPSKDPKAPKPKPQVWTLPLDAPGEARQLTALEHGASNPVWRPDSHALLVISRIPKSKIPGQPHYDTERPGREYDDITRPADDAHDDADSRPDGDLTAIRHWLEANARDDNPVVSTRLAFQDELSLMDERAFSHLFLVELDADSASEPRQLTDGFKDHLDPQWTPDASHIVYVDHERDDTHTDRKRRSAIFLIQADGQNDQAFLADSAISIDSPRFSVGAKALSFRTTEMQDWLYAQPRLASTALRRIQIIWSSGDWPSDCSPPVATSDDKLLFSSRWEGSTPLFLTNLRHEEGDPVRIIPDTVETLAFDEAGGRILAAISTPENPCELYEINRDGTRKRLTDLNTSFLADKRISVPEERWIEREDGARIQYWVMPPTDIQPGEKYPTVLQIHGGPMAMWGPAESSMWHEFQLMCSFGYGVVYSNPRGSGGYGKDFQRANHADWGHTPSSDVLACLDQAIADNDWIDTDRLVITGGSYAGYLTAWIIAHDDRFKAAVAQRGVYDLETFFGEGNAWILVEHAFGGFPWQPEIRDLLVRESPFTHVNNITTPFLIMHGSNDLRTGVSQSEMMYRALKELERPVEYVRYPGAGHDLSRTGDPKQRMDRLLRIIEFFERYSDNPRPTPAKPAEQES